MNSFKSTIRQHAMSQIKDADIAQMFIISATNELMKFLQRREEKCHRNAGEDCKHDEGETHHVHHTQCDHHKFEDGVQ